MDLPLPPSSLFMNNDLYGRDGKTDTEGWKWDEWTVKEISTVLTVAVITKLHEVKGKGA